MIKGFVQVLTKNSMGTCANLGGTNTASIKLYKYRERRICVQVAFFGKLDFGCWNDITPKLSVFC